MMIDDIILAGVAIIIVFQTSTDLALEVFLKWYVLYKSTFYLLTYLLKKKSVINRVGLL